MNNKGLAVLVYFMIAILFFLLGLAFAFPIVQTKNQATNSTEMNCTDTSILTNQQKAECTSMDIIPMLFTGAIFGLGGVLLTKLAFT